MPQPSGLWCRQFTRNWILSLQGSTCGQRTASMSFSASKTRVERRGTSANKGTMPYTQGVNLNTLGQDVIPPGTRWFMASKTYSKLWAFQPTCVKWLHGEQGTGDPSSAESTALRPLGSRSDTPNVDRWLQDKSYRRRAVRRWLQRVSYADFCRRRVCCTQSKMHFESKPERSWPASTMKSPVIQEWTGRIGLDVGWRSSTVDLHQVDRTTAAPTSSGAIQTDGPVKPAGTN